MASVIVRCPAPPHSSDGASDLPSATLSSSDQVLRLAEDGISLDRGLPAEEATSAKRHTKFVREGSYAAEVDVQLIEEDNGWSPYLSLDDARRLDAVRKALRREDLDSASRLGRVFSLTPVRR